MKKLYVCDFDGTIYINNDIRLLKQIKTEMERLIDDGNEILIATGRPLHLLEPFFENFDNIWFAGNDGALLSKGFDIYYENDIDKKLLKNIVNKSNIDYVLYGQCISYIHSKSTRLKRELNKFFYSQTVLVDDINDIEENVYKAVFFGDIDCDGLLKKSWNSYGINEYVSKGVDKAGAVSEFQRMLGIDKSKTIVIGDGINDINMMRLADKSYALRSAAPLVKKSADYVVENALEVLRRDY